MPEESNRHVAATDEKLPYRILHTPPKEESIRVTVVLLRAPLRQAIKRREWPMGNVGFTPLRRALPGRVKALASPVPRRAGGAGEFDSWSRLSGGAQKSLLVFFGREMARARRR